MGKDQTHRVDEVFAALRAPSSLSEQHKKRLSFLPLSPTNMAPVGRHLEDKFPLGGGREGKLSLHRGVSPFSGELMTFEGNTPLILGRVYFKLSPNPSNRRATNGT